MRRYSSAILAAMALCLVLLLLFGDDSYGNLIALERSLATERKKNDDLESRVKDLRRQLYGLKRDDRHLEQLARNEFGLARPDELIFLFDGTKAPHFEGDER